MRSFDTTPEAERIQLEVFRRMGPEKRLEAAIALSQTCRKLLMEGIRRRHPEYDERHIRLATIRLMLPENRSGVLRQSRSCQGGARKTTYA